MLSLFITTGNPNNSLEDSNTVKNTIKEYNNHQSSINIKNQTNVNVNTYDFPDATAEEINKIIKDINPKKATGPNKTPPKIIKLSASMGSHKFMFSSVEAVLDRPEQCIEAVSQNFLNKHLTEE